MTSGVDKGGINVMPVTGGVAAFDGARGRSQILNLTANTTISGAQNMQTGELFTVAFLQDQTGGWTLTWPANFKAPPTLNLDPLGKTEMFWAADELGNYYPFGSAFWSLR
jgi:hypothetical protein